MNGRFAVSLRAALTVAAVYGYFLIFAQFSFVELLRSAGVESTGEKLLLGLMAAAGVFAGFLTAWRGPSSGMIRGALVCAGLAAVLSTTRPGYFGFALASILTGASLGAATVALAALLPGWCRVAWVGLGTGLAYGACNLPWVFTGSPVEQAWIGAGFSLLGVVLVPGTAAANDEESSVCRPFPVWVVLLLFTALVWMDSAAFFIIQHAADLKSGTWGGSMLWRNAAVHFLFAGGAGVWLARGSARWLPVLAWVLLSVAALLVNDESSRPVAAWIYPAAVSLYSTALVAWPGWFSGLKSDARAIAWRAAWLFAIAGWFGSANGIGMVQTLSRVPSGFVVAAGLAVVSALVLADIGRWRIWLVIAATGVVSWMFGGVRVSPMLSEVERGRLVYVSEGCLHCHSQYVRPGSPDESIWGGPRELDKVVGEQPVLIGNRRQGPDLTNIGSRRSPAWLKAHFIEPQTLVPRSAMPSYAHLFADRRGDDLVRYLSESGRDRIEEVRGKAARWTPGPVTTREDGRLLFSKHCAACHGEGGLGDGPLAKRLSKPPANLVKGPFLWTPPGEDLGTRVARVIKFGVPGSDMPGHEVMTDAQIMSLKDEVLGLRANP